MVKLLLYPVLNVKPHTDFKEVCFIIMTFRCFLCTLYFLLELKQEVLSRQREYKIAAIQAKQSGNIDQAKQYYLTAKVGSRASVASSKLSTRSGPLTQDVLLTCRSWIWWSRQWTEMSRWTWARFPLLLVSLDPKMDEWPADSINTIKTPLLNRLLCRWISRSFLPAVACACCSPCCHGKGGPYR